MKRRPQNPSGPALSFKVPAKLGGGDIGLVLSGGGSRAAYQTGALKALIPYFEKHPAPISVVMGSSIGAINGLTFSACLKGGYSHAVTELEGLWRERNFRNTFVGSPSTAFIRAIKLAFVQYMSPGPKPTRDAIFDPSPLMARVDQVITAHGGLSPESRLESLKAVGVMTTIEGRERKPLVFLSSHKRLAEQLMTGATFETCYVDSLTAKHGFASAALPSVLPPVEIDTEHGKIRLIDGGISQNVPVDPAVRLGAEKVIIVDISGRNWWLDHYGEAHDTRPDWEVPAAPETFCMRPPDTFLVRPSQPLGPILRDAVKGSTKKFIAAVGPVWPVFSLLKQKLGEDVAYEVMSYVALDADYVHGLIERGYEETRKLMLGKSEVTFTQSPEVERMMHAS